VPCLGSVKWVSSCATTYSTNVGGRRIIRQWKLRMPSAEHEPQRFPKFKIRMCFGLRPIRGARRCPSARTGTDTLKRIQLALGRWRAGFRGRGRISRSGAYPDH
jgi:hypothetical protein